MNNEQIKELAETTSRSKSNTKRIDKLEEQTELIYQISTNVALIANRTDNTEKTVVSLKTDVEEIKSKPNKFIDKAKEIALGVVIGAIVGAFIALIL